MSGVFRLVFPRLIILQSVPAAVVHPLLVAAAVVDKLYRKPMSVLVDQQLSMWVPVELVVPEIMTAPQIMEKQVHDLQYLEVH